VSSDNLKTIQAEFQTGKTAFERGEYRKSVQHLEKANELADSSSRLEGEIQTWLVTAYEAAGKREEAIALCRSLTRHPDLNTRKQGKRLLYILEAPKLRSRPEWLTQIPDLAHLADSDRQDRKGGSVSSSRSQSVKPAFQLEPVDPNQINTQDNRFIWVALVAAVLVLGGLLWFAQVT
jgi:tetratricopeptide (TPR) repeat protein